MSADHLQHWDPAIAALIKQAEKRGEARGRAEAASPLTAEEYVIVTEALAADQHGCWDHEMCCWASAEAMRKAVDTVLRARADQP